MIVWDTGTGKTHAAMRLSTLLVEDGLIDLTLLIAEKGKVGEWKEDYDKFTSLSSSVHHGSGRMKRLEKAGMPQVLITTYETAKADLTDFIRSAGGRGTSATDGPLMSLVEPLRTLVVYDEPPVKLRNRSSATYKSHFRTVKALRKAFPEHTRVIGLTATPLEKDYEDAFNQLRIIRPDLMPSVSEFETEYVVSRDIYGRPKYHPNKIMHFVELCQKAIIRKRKTDPDVINQFPARVEESMHLQMKEDQRALYETVESLQYMQDEPVPGLWTVLRQIAGHPASILYAQDNPDGSKIAKMVIEEVGAEVIRQTSSAKEEALLKYLETLVKGQGAKVVIFTFFGQSILKVLNETLTKQGYRVYLNHGQMSVQEQTDSRKAFRGSSEPCIFLTSDAGARGINLPEATYVIEYESALTYANRTQRLDRIHRIDSEAPSVTCMTLMLDGTVEEPIALKMIDRNEQTDILLGDADAGENFMSAPERKAALKIARTYRKARN